ncbi:unknown [Clostridium sp. CAG:448]|nr:unknown [Clostridium sp. CAG:448]
MVVVILLSSRIMPGDGVAQSYATNIARKYKLSKDEIIKSTSTKIANDP